MAIYILDDSQYGSSIKDDLRRICPDQGLTFNPIGQEPSNWLQVNFAQTYSSIVTEIIRVLTGSPIEIRIRGGKGSDPIPLISKPIQVLSERAGVTIYDKYPNTSAIEIIYDLENARGCNGRGYWTEGLEESRDTLKVWVAAFIPKEMAGLTKPVPGNSNNTMISGPTPISDCFLTDQRTFIQSPSSSSRMRSMVEVDIASMKLISQDHHCDNTVEVDCEDGSIECNQTPDKSRLKLSNFTSVGNKCTFTFKGGAGNACVTGAPDIDWEVNVIIEFQGIDTLTITVADGSLVEPFPAFEMYASLGGETKALFQTPPDPGASPWDLIGGPSKAVSGSTSFTVNSGRIPFWTDVCLFHELAHAYHFATNGFSSWPISAENDAIKIENIYRATRQPMLSRRTGLIGGCYEGPPYKPDCTSGTGKGCSRPVTPSTPSTPTSGKKNDGCFIATAALEGGYEEQLQLLRDFRDGPIKSTRRGSDLFQEFYLYYYEFAPSIAELIRLDQKFKDIALGGFVLPALNYLKLSLNFPDTEIPHGMPEDWSNYLREIRGDLENWSKFAMPPLLNFPEDYTQEDVISDQMFVMSHVLRSPDSRRKYRKAISNFKKNNDIYKLNGIPDQTFLSLMPVGLGKTQKFLLKFCEENLLTFRRGKNYIHEYLVYFDQISSKVILLSNTNHKARFWLILAFLTPLANYLKLTLLRPISNTPYNLSPEWNNFVMMLQEGIRDWLDLILPPLIDFPEDYNNQDIKDDILFIMKYVLREEKERNKYIIALQNAGVLSDSHEIIDLLKDASWE